MEDKQSSLIRKLISIHDEKLIKQIDYDTVARTSKRHSKKQHLLGNNVQYHSHLL